MVERLTDTERKEFSGLKRIKHERGFLLPNEELRWNYLFDKNASAFMSGMKALEFEWKQMENN